MSETLLMIGTRKGLWIGRSDDRLTWTWEKPRFLMEEVYSCMVDKRSDAPRLMAGASTGSAGFPRSNAAGLLRVKGSSTHGRPTHASLIHPYQATSRLRRGPSTPGRTATAWSTHL